MRCAWIKINVDRLSLRLRATSGRAFSDWQLHQWLQDAGFQWVGGHWFTCPSEGAGVLLADEVLDKQTRETIDGVTFVERDVRRPPGPAGPAAL
jgi:hypothetical protein